MTITTDVIADRLHQAWPTVRTGEAMPLSGGFWASMFRVSVTGQPDGVADDVVVRFAPHKTMGAKEAEVQQAVAAQGFPTPPVWLSAADQAGDGWWSVMSFCEGSPLLAGLDGATVVRRAPGIVRNLPVQLAQTMAALHRLDPEPITAAVRGVAPEVAWSTGDVLRYLHFGAIAADRSDVAAALEQLDATRPGSRSEVLCHGDLHPFNILDDGEHLVVLDWTGALVADPCYDLALTRLLLANPPLALPRPLGPIGRLAGRLLARRFVATYARARPDVSLKNLEWFQALHSARVLIEVTNMRAKHGPSAGGHPWTAVAPAAQANLVAATGLDVKA